ncbi:MAG TPA: hypothetical protein VJY36_06385 [Candidatus Bathyarchaeia archaeon]|nr:hypothetical protein [Candidatus Bathyarchaeia archaeon]
MSLNSAKQDATGNINWPLRSGIFLVLAAWFIYVVYEGVLGIYNRHTTIPLVREDIAATVGLGFVVAASAIAVLIMLFYLVKRDLSRPELTMATRIILFAVGAYFVLAFLPAVFVEGLPGTFNFSIMKVFEVTLPCIVDGIAIPVVLAKLFLTLNPNMPAKEIIKWSLIAGSVYLFAFWVNNAGNWIGAVIAKGPSYLTYYPVNMFSFLLTTVGLLLLSLYTVFFSKKTIGKNDLAEADYRRIGLIFSFTGLYLTFTLLLWFIFGSVGGWGSWYAWLLGHGYLDLWGLTIPFIGLPLLFYKNNSAQKATSGLQKESTLPLSKKQLYPFLFFIEGLGIIFYAVFSAAYYIPVPSTKVLIGEAIFKIPITVFGLLYFISIILIIIFSIANSR